MRLASRIAWICLFAAPVLAQGTAAPTAPAPLVTRGEGAHLVDIGTADAEHSGKSEDAALGGQALGGQAPGGTYGSPVPEPSTLFLVGTGILGVALTYGRRQKRAR